jgi:hypothetical protein
MRVIRSSSTPTAMADLRLPLRSQPALPASHDYGSGLNTNMKELLAWSGLHECVQFYARHFYGAPDGVAEGLMTQEMLVYALEERKRKRRENQESVRRLKIALAEAGESLRAATAR